MQELLRMRDAGELNEIQMQWFRDSKPAEELFDTWNDPHEINNLAEDPAYAEKLTELRTECDRWMKEIDDKGSVHEGDLITTFWPDWEQPLTSNPEMAQDGDQVTVACPTPGANIVFQITSPGQEPDPGKWEVYINPVRLPPGSSLSVQAHRLGFKPSQIINI